MSNPNEQYFCNEYHFHNYDVSGFKLLFCGHERCKPNSGERPHVRDVYIIHLILSGRGRVIAENAVFNIDENMVFIVFPNEVSSYFADQEEPWEYVWFGLTGSLIAEILSNCHITENFPIAKVNASDVLASLALNIIDYSKNQNTINILRSNGIMLDFFATLISETNIFEANKEPITSNKSENHYLRKAVEYINQNLTKPICISDLTKFVGLNRSYFSRLFKKHYRTSPSDFINSQKLTLASHMLLHTNFSIQYVAEHFGFSDVAYFTRRFKKFFQKTPTDFRKSNLYTE